MLTRIVAKTLVFNERGELLLLVRSSDDLTRPGGYDLPGGKIEADESIAVGAAREVAEEAGLSIPLADLQLAFATAKVAHQAEFGAKTNTIWFGFTAKLPTSGQVVLSAEHQSHEWLTIDKAIVKSEGITQRAFMCHLKDNNIMPDLWDR